MPSCIICSRNTFNCGETPNTEKEAAAAVCGNGAGVGIGCGAGWGCGVGINMGVDILDGAGTWILGLGSCDGVGAGGIFGEGNSLFSTTASEPLVGSGGGKLVGRSQSPRKLGRFKMSGTRTVVPVVIGESDVGAVPVFKPKNTIPLNTAALIVIISKIISGRGFIIKTGLHNGWKTNSYGYDRYSRINQTWCGCGRRKPKHI